MQEKTAKFILTKWQGREKAQSEELVVSEYPLTIFFNQQELVTLLCTPENLKALALGFIKTEGLIKSIEEIASLSVDTAKGIVEIKTKESNFIEEKLYSKRLIPTGCGSCGKGGLFFNIIDSIKCKPVKNESFLVVDKVYTFMKKILAASEIFRLTGGLHTAALCNQDEVLVVCEDIARHNAMDKVIGESLLRGIKLKDKIILVSGRVSSEMLLKTAKLEIPIIISKSAPTHLAVELAKELNLTLIGFVRGERMNVYAHDWRIK